MLGSKTFYTYLSEYVQASPDRKILGYYNSWMTNTELLERIEATAYALKQRGVKRGDMVAMLTSRSPQSVVGMLALQTLGAVAVLCDPHTKVKSFLANCGVELPVRFIWTNEVTNLSIWDGDNMCLTDCESGATAELDPLLVESHACPEVDGDPKALGFIIFTSGSTGKSKAVMLCQMNIEAALIANYPLSYYDEDDIALGILALDHIFGLVLMAGTFVLRHAIYLAQEASVSAILKTIEQVGITRMNGTPQLFLAMAAQKNNYDLSSLRAGLIGSAPFTAEQFAKIEADLEMTLSPIYGMSEYAEIACGCYKDPQHLRASSNGGFCEMNKGKILLDDGTEAGVGEIGEICVDGPMRMLGYYGDPGSTSGMIRTGDLGYLDEHGMLHISGRKKDIIIRNGNNLSPRRIEEAILAVPGVKECCVVGIPNERCGEVPCAMAVAPGMTEDAIQLAIKGTLSKIERPEGILVVDALPLLRTGKTDRQTIRKILADWEK